MKLSKRQLRKIIREEFNNGMAHQTHGLGKSIADVEFPVLVRYGDQSEIAYTEDELDSILDLVAPIYGPGTGMPYSLEQLTDVEPPQRPYGKGIENLAAGKKIEITKSKLCTLIREYEQYFDEDGNVWDDEGNVTRRGASFGRRYGGGTYGTNAPWQGGRSRYSRRKTTHVGADANAEKIAAIKRALEEKPNNSFLTSILSQLTAGRGLSSKQNAIVKKILLRIDKEASSLFEVAIFKELLLKELK